MNRKHVLMAALILVAVSLMPCKAQMEKLPPMGQFVLQGKMENVNPEKPGKVRLAVCDVWENELFEIPIQSDGSFMKTLPIRDIQEVYLYMGNTIVLNVCAGDTITMTCDYKQWKETLDISGHTPERDRELKLSMELYHRMRERQLELDDALSKPLRDFKVAAPDTTLMKQVVKYVEDYAHIVEEWEQAHGILPHKEAFLIQAFFNPLNLFAGNAEALSSLLYGWNLQKTIPSLSINSPVLRTPRPQWLIHSSYRSFISSYCESVQTQAVIAFYGNATGNNESFILRAKVGDLVIPDRVIREYGLVDMLNMQIRYIGYDKLTEYIAYLDSTVTTPWIREQLESIKQTNSVWAVGRRAPEFDFVDADGKHYTLADFKGRFIYLDIWGVGCGPCYREFKNMPALHEKYKEYEDRMAYVYLCGNYSSKDVWLRTAERHDLSGYNLALPEGDKGHYNINVFPTYILIDPDGKIVEYNTDRPSELLRERVNVLDMALKKERIKR